MATNIRCKDECNMSTLISNYCLHIIRFNFVFPESHYFTTMSMCMVRVSNGYVLNGVLDCSSAN